MPSRGLDTLHVMAGHAIFEILQRGITKGRALRRFMRRPPFAGRIPVFVGDDATDEDGMRAAAAEGGFGVKIGPEETAAAYRLPDTEAVHNWLSRLTKSRPRRGTLAQREPLAPTPSASGHMSREAGMNRLFVVSNRVGPLSDDRKAGGLAVGLADALRKRGGVWFGWSGKTSAEGTFGPLQIKTEGERAARHRRHDAGRHRRILQRLSQTRRSGRSSTTASTSRISTGASPKHSGGSTSGSAAACARC